MSIKTLLCIGFGLFLSALNAQIEETMVSIPFNADEDDFMGIPVLHNYQGIVIPASIDSTYKIVYSDSSVMDVVKKGKEISFVFRKSQTSVTGQFTIAPCPLSNFVALYNFDLNEYVVRKVDFFTAYRTGKWKINEGTATRNLITMPVRFVEPCK